MAGAEPCTYTTDEALSRLGFGRFQALLLGVLGTGWIAEAMEIMLQSFVGPSVKAEWGVSGAEEGLVTSVVFVGMLIGACAGGLGSDRFGRSTRTWLRKTARRSFEMLQLLADRNWTASSARRAAKVTRISLLILGRGIVGDLESRQSATAIHCRRQSASENLAIRGDAPIVAGGLATNRRGASSMDGTSSQSSQTLVRRRGRLGFLFTTFITGISGFLCAFSPNYASLITLRFAVGLGLGASHVLPTWFLEFVPAESRGSWMAAFSCFFTLGTILEALLAWAVMPILGWRWLLGLSSLPCFILLIFSASIPESPRYLCSRGRASDAMLVLERIERMNNRSLPPGILTSDLKRRGDHKIDASITTLLLMPEDNHRIDDDTSSKSDGINEFRALWSHELIRSTLLLWLVYFSCFFAYYGIVQLTSEVSNGNRSCASVGPHLMQPKDSSLYINVLVTSFAEFPGLLVAALLIDRVGRRVSMGGLILLCCASVVPLAIYLRGGFAVTLLFCARTFSLGCFAVLRAYSPEIYPTSCRNTGVGVATSISRIGSAIAPLMTITLLENCLEKEAVFAIVLPLFLAGLGCAFFPLETKGRDMS